MLSFFFQAEDGIRDGHVTGVQTCALPICLGSELERLRLELFEHGGLDPCRDEPDGPGQGEQQRRDREDGEERGLRGQPERSEERRVGKGGGARWGASREKKAQWGEARVKR